MLLVSTSIMYQFTYTAEVRTEIGTLLGSFSFGFNTITC